MSRSSVLASTIAIPEIINKPQVQEGWVKLTALMRTNHTFEHVSDLVPPTLLSQQAGAFPFKFKLSVDEADQLGRGREKLDDGYKRNQTHFNSRVLIRSFKLQDGEVKMDCFPTNTSARVNDVFYKREGKDGPMDITAHVKFSPLITNVINLDLPSPSGLYVVNIILVKALSPSTIVQRLTDKRIRSAEFTKSRIRRYHELSCADVAVTSTKFSLVCPLMQTRFVVPAQGENCNHLSCFDLYTYLKLNVRSGKWMCPICNVKVLPTHLIVDGYWNEIVDLFTKENNNSTSVLVTGEGMWNSKIEPATQPTDENDIG